MKSVKLKSINKDIFVGDSNPVIVNCNIGANNSKGLDYEKRKLDHLFRSSETTPNTLMDLSIFEKKGLLVNHIIKQFGCPVGVVPIYAFKNTEISESNLIEQITRYAEMGVSFMTMHMTADQDIYQIALKDRRIPVTSRGGALTLKESFGSKKCNIFRRCLNEIIQLSHKYDFVISLGTTFRPASIIDACDRAHTLETERQIELSKYLHKNNVQIIVENVGHLSVDNIFKHSTLLRKCECPIMPLGPSVIDSAIGYDHIVSAIGASFMAYNNIAHIINAISPVEHKTSFFSIKDTESGIIAAKIAAQSINSCRFKSCLAKEQDTYLERAKLHSCIITGDKNCKRCDELCPLKLNINGK